VWLQQHVDAKKVDTTAGQDIVRVRKADSDVPEAEHVYVVTGVAIHVMMTQAVTDITVLNLT